MTLQEAVPLRAGGGKVLDGHQEEQAGGDSGRTRVPVQCRHPETRGDPVWWDRILLAEGRRVEPRQAERAGGQDRTALHKEVIKMWTPSGVGKRGG